jgi:hypothetical protein
MKPFRVGTTRRAIILASLGVIGFVVAGRALQAASSAELLLHATLLVLKDGRIANVSIHVVPFARAAPTSPPSPRPPRRIDARGRHRLLSHCADRPHRFRRGRRGCHLECASARALARRCGAGGADRRGSAGEGDRERLGLAVHGARATLWVFQLTAGEDCEGRPLQGDIVATAPQSTGQEASAEPQGRAIVSALAPAEPTPARGVADAPVAARIDTVPPPAEPAPARGAADAPVAARVDTAPPPAEPAPARSASQTGPASRVQAPKTRRKRKGAWPGARERDPTAAGGRARDAPARQAAAPARETATTPQPPATDGKVERNPESAQEAPGPRLADRRHAHDHLTRVVVGDVLRR